MTAHVIEGTWSEILSQADRFAGKRLRVQVLESPTPGTFSDHEFEAALDLLAQGSESLPILSDEATTRAASTAITIDALSARHGYSPPSQPA
jgi:hypothetical protein